MGGKPLEGYRVFDLTQAVAGPFCTALLGDFGAEVIHIERPIGDATRTLHPRFKGTATSYLSYNRGKKSIQINFKKPLGREIALKLASKCDIFVENSRPGSAAKLGLSYEDIKKVKEDIIYISISGFGQDGPNKERAAYDGVIQAESGFMSVTGPEGGPYTKAGTSIADLVSGLYAAYGAALAVIRHKQTGEGTYLDCAMFDVFTSLMENPIAAYLNAGEERKPMGSLHPQSGIFGTIPTSDGELIVCLATNTQHRVFFELLDLPDLTKDERFKNSYLRRQNLDDLMAYVSPKTRQYTTSQLIKLLDENGLAYGEIKTIPQVVESELMKTRRNIIPILDKANGAFQIYGQPLKFSNIETPQVTYGAQLGEHNKEILRDILGMDDEEAEAILKEII